MDVGVAMSTFLLSVVVQELSLQDEGHYLVSSAPKPFSHGRWIEII